MSHTPEWPPSPEAMNHLLPAFEFTAKITSSDLGAVFFANQKSLDRQVALKVFSPLLSADPEFRKAFGDSCKLAAGLRHSNIIGILDSGEVGGMLYLVMEFVPGKSLARSTRGHIVEFGQSLTIIDAICEGLAHAHEAGLVHGHLDDLSVLLNQDALPKIGSFGFGRIVHTHLSETTSTHFIAPEVLANPSAATKASDVYSVAAIFHGLITGKPYSPEAPAPSTVSDCPPAVNAVIKCATDPDPHKRYSDARAFQAALNRATAKPTAIPVRAAKVVNAATTRVLPKADSGSIFLLKITIIIVLLIAIFFAWEMKKKALADIERENLEIVTRQKLANLLAATRASLAGAAPVFPPGTVISGERRYLFVKRPVTWAEADVIAKSSGGHLLVAATSEEIAEIARITHRIEAQEGIWLGGSLDDSLWQWVTGEPWKTAVWADDSKASKDDVALVLIPRKGWTAMERGNTADGLLIEWSADEKATKSGSTTPAGNHKTAQLDAKVKELILAAIKIRENEHADNIKKLHWDLDLYIKGSNSTIKEQYGPSVKALQENVDDNRLDIDAIKTKLESGEIQASSQMLKLVNYHCEKQVAIAAKAEAGIGIIRNAYVAKITVLKDEAEAAGQIKVFDDLEGAIEDAKNLKSWVKSFGAGGD